jgi:hypothetical protein
VKNAERDLFVETGLHDAVDDFAVRAVTAKRDDGPRPVRDRFLAHSQAISLGCRELKIHGP